jgi:type I restriction enzyme, S subunit
MKIGDICEVVRGSSPRPRDDSRYYDGPVPRLMIADVTRDGKYVSAKIDSLTELGAKQSRPMSSGEVVIAVSGAPGLPAVLAHDACIHDGFVGLRKLDTTQVNIDFLYRYLIFVRLQSSGRAVGAIFKNLTTEQIRETIIPDFPIAQQKHIAAILDQAEALRSLRRQSIGQLDALGRSVFLEMFGDLATNPNKFSIVKLGELTRITSGSTPSRTISENFIGSIPWVKTTEVCGNLILETEEKISELALKNSSCHIYPIGSIIVALYGQGKTRGRAAILGIDAATNQACGVLLPHAKYNTQFLFWQLQLSYDRLRELGRGGNQPNLNLGLLGDFYVLLPPLSLQQEFADRIGAIEALKAQHRESLAKMDTLFASLQHRAFRGEL